MKRIISGIIVFVAGLFAPQILQAQGTIYVSNLGASAGSMAVGSNSWLSAGFATGFNADGYELNSVQLAMTDASGNPNGFTVMLYNQGQPTAIRPGSSLGTLDGSTDPATTGIYTYTPASNITLSPNTYYFIVLTAGTAVANGAYEWNESTSHSVNGGWGELNGIGHSSDGLSWGGGTTSNYPQFAINVTDIPESGVLGLFALGGLCFLRHRRKARV
jgi:hypothetical protein